MRTLEVHSPVIEVRRLCLDLEGKAILRDVSFAVEPGEYLAIVGPNGAGKTTLLRCIDRLLASGQGEIRVFGRSLASYRQRELARRISYVPQAGEGTLPYTVDEFVLMGRYPYLSPFATISREDRRAVAEAVARAGVEALGGRQLATLSGGERQKVYIAAALAQGADVLLLDEPTTFLDYRHQAEIRDLLADLHRGGTTIVAVTHDVNQAALDAQRVLALRGGAVVFHGPTAALMNAARLAELYGTEFLLVEHPGAGRPIIVPRATVGGRP